MIVKELIDAYEYEKSNLYIRIKNANYMRDMHFSKYSELPAYILNKGVGKFKVCGENMMGLNILEITLSDTTDKHGEIYISPNPTSIVASVFLGNATNYFDLYRDIGNALKDYEYISKFNYNKYVYADDVAREQCKLHQHKMFVGMRHADKLYADRYLVMLVENAEDSNSTIIPGLFTVKVVAYIYKDYIERYKVEVDNKCGPK